MIIALLLITARRQLRIGRSQLIFALAAACTAPACVFANDFRSQRPHPAVARIVVPEGTATSYGSGTLIDVRDDFGLVITNWHVVRDARGPIEVLFPNGQHSRARALKVDADWDLAALVIWRPQVEPVQFATAAPRPGDELTICGYGPGVYRAVTGRCTGYYAPQLDLPQQMVELDVQARQGDSGGPIFDECGCLAGVLFGAGHGTTLGSFSGRVGSFLATLAPDIGIPAGVDQEIAQPEPAAPTKPAASQIAQTEPAEQRATDDQPWTSPGPALTAMWSASAEAGLESAPPQAIPQPPRLPARDSWLGHAKTILAAVGMAAVVAQLLRAAR